MINPMDFRAALDEADIRFITGVPDSLLKDVCACISSSYPAERHIIAANEGGAIGLAIGHYLATARPTLVYMQNSGLGNVVNPIASLADSQVNGIPMLLMVGWRGEMKADGTQLHDEPQHVKQGQITIAQLDILGIPYQVIDENTQNINIVLKDLVNLALERSGPVALLVRKQTFSSFKLSMQRHDEHLLTREAAIKLLIDNLPVNTPVVSTTGMASRELFEYRKATNAGHHRDFLTVGGMGHASQIATGIALAQPNNKVLCIDGDGAVLMHMGSLAISAKQANLIHVVINNGAHDSVGGQATVAEHLNLSKVAADCGYGFISQASTAQEVVKSIKASMHAKCSVFIEVKCKCGAKADLGRPDRTPSANKLDFMKFLQGVSDAG
jgi:phosphonopyruvate decarboxylase